MPPFVQQPLQRWTLTIAAGLALFLLGTAHGQGTDPIDIRVQLRKGERLTLQLVNERTQALPGKPANKTQSVSTVSAEVESVSQTNMLVRWRRSGGRVVEPPEPELFSQRMLELQETGPLELELSAAGTVLEVRNWRAVQQAMQGRADELVKELVRGGAKPEIAGMLGSRVKASIDTQQGVEKFTADSAYIYFALSGRTVRPDQATEYAGELTSPFGNEPVPAPILLTIKSQDVAAGTITIRSEQKADPEETRRLMVALMKRAASEQSRPFDEAQLPKSIALGSVSEYLIEVANGLPIKVVHGREVNVDGVVQVDSTGIQRVGKQF